jgi:trehalose utilization protein
MSDAENWYDQYAQQSPTNVPVKSTTTFKGNKSIQYKYRDSEGKRIYLIDLGSKVYVVTSLNESLNIQNDPLYGDKFNSFFESLEVAKP